MWEWDKGIDFEEMLNKILGHMNKTKKHISKCYDSILLIQLMNGARVSEAIRAYKEYIKSKSTELYVKVSKKKGEDLRLMVIPNNIHICSEFLEIDDKVLRNRIKGYAYYNYKKLNTHSLRYAFITYLLRRNIDATIIAKITHHSNLNHILTYTQQKVADNILKSLVKAE